MSLNLLFLFFILRSPFPSSLRCYSSIAWAIVCLSTFSFPSIAITHTLAMDDTMEKVLSQTVKRRQSTATGHGSIPQAGDTELLGVYIARLIGNIGVTIDRCR